MRLASVYAIRAGLVNQGIDDFRRLAPQSEAPSRRLAQSGAPAKAQGVRTGQDGRDGIVAG